MSEPVEVLLSGALQALKISVAKRLPERPFWTVRYHDFDGYSRDKVVEKVKYLHRNPVARGLCRRPEDWEWSSCWDHFSCDGIVAVDFSYVTGSGGVEAVVARGAVVLRGFWGGTEPTLIALCGFEDGLGLVGRDEGGAPKLMYAPLKTGE